MIIEPTTINTYGTKPNNNRINSPPKPVLATKKIPNASVTLIPIAALPNSTKPLDIIVPTNATNNTIDEATIKVIPIVIEIPSKALADASPDAAPATIHKIPITKIITDAIKAEIGVVNFFIFLFSPL